MPLLVWAALLPSITVISLGGIYLFSRDPGRRSRALHLITLLRHRSPEQIDGPAVTGAVGRRRAVR